MTEVVNESHADSDIMSNQSRIFCCFLPCICVRTRSRRILDSGVQPSNSSKDLKSKPTPIVIDKSDELTEHHKYFCPICMYYLANMQKTKCCGHHICIDCVKAIKNHKASQQAELETAQDVENTVVSCPHCACPNLQLESIRTHEESRRYEDSPALHPDSKGSRRLTPGLQQVAPSPLKVGDSHENMMRKLITFDQCGINIKGHVSSPTIQEGGSETPSSTLPLPGVPIPPLPEDQIRVGESDRAPRLEQRLFLDDGSGGEASRAASEVQSPQESSQESSGARPPRPASSPSLTSPPQE
mmetsp:Transcript_20566/g.46590  ORF Transcript_20566/g.46590 Transcript_20566/m.46590 type:complete len:299 (-) Transcript_20566:73-969(-)